LTFLVSIGHAGNVISALVPCGPVPFINAYFPVIVVGLPRAFVTDGTDRQDRAAARKGNARAEFILGILAIEQGSTLRP
jgi:hypothetical protein